MARPTRGPLAPPRGRYNSSRTAHVTPEADKVVRVGLSVPSEAQGDRSKSGPWDLINGLGRHKDEGPAVYPWTENPKTLLGCPILFIV